MPLDRVDVDDQRVVGRPPLGFEQPLHRRAIERMHAQAINRLSGKRDKAAAAQTLGSARQRSASGVAGSTRITSVIAPSNHSTWWHVQSGEGGR